MRAVSPIQELKRLLPQCLLPDQVRIGSRLAEALGRWRQGDRRPFPLDRWLAEARASVALRERRGLVLQHVHYPRELPISAHREPIINALRQHPVVIVAGETGSGKTTQLPKMCLEAGLGLRARIGCTQPRRVAAVSLSRRLAEELEVTWGQEVGCRIRFSDHSRPETSVKFMTDGILLAEVQGDPLLSDYEAIILDEAHERSINIDFLLGYFRQLVSRRDDLKLLITSATIDTELFARSFQGAPVIQVSGRLYPVEVRYSPLDEHAEEEGEVTYIDAAVNTVESLLAESGAGDALVFMPGERDIRETVDRLERLDPERLEVVPLYGRLTVDEQHRIFLPGPRRRVVVATNIAETSLTVPRIRYVVDPGLARISRYHPGTRSRRLPVEAISQSSASQRRGRCGRVAAGVCVRLYSEADFQARRPYTEPEIQRCNLADVVLRMKAFHLGEVETFPFIEAPTPAAIRGAYELLQELGALDEARALTPLGRDLARLPVDPAIGRMILQARKENALQEVLVIAAGLSIQDPRERPLDRQDEAEAAHRRFRHPESDFLSLLNIWRAYHDTWETLKTQNQMRKFCKAHFLSFLRMREWCDLYAQVREALDDLGEFTVGPLDAGYAAIHRSILTGLLGQVAERVERNVFRLAGSRQVALFPGSGLFEKAGRSTRRTAAVSQEAAPEVAPAQPAWVVAGEVFETSRPYLRTVAAIQPEWVIDLASHLWRRAYDQPRWDRKAGRVLARERLILRGLVLRERLVGYLRVDPAEATRIFIQAALVEGDLPGCYPFLEHNTQVRERLAFWQTHLRQHGRVDLDAAMFDFYASRLGQVGSVHDLDRCLKTAGNADYLCARPEDLLGELAARFDAAALPATVPVGTQNAPVIYAYAPGEEHDGVTVRLTAPLAELVDPELMEWAVPALREERVLQLLRLLPKGSRRPLMPLDAAAREIVRGVKVEAGSFLAGMSEFVRRRYGVDIPAPGWPLASLPPHLRPRFEILGRERQTLIAGRDLAALRAQVERHETTAEMEAWKVVAQKWERYGLTAWNFGDLPLNLVVAEIAGFPLYAWPALQLEEEEVHLRLLRRQTEAEAAHPKGVARLAELTLRRDLAWVHKELRALSRSSHLYATLGSAEELAETAWDSVRQHLFPEVESPPRSAQAFAEYVEAARRRLPGLMPRFLGWVNGILEQRQQALLIRHPFPELRPQLNALVPPQFLRRIPFERLAQMPRYLHALITRAERAALNPAKDAEKAGRVRPYLEALRELQARPLAQSALRQQVDQFRWLVEEFKVSCFAQELGTAVPVSAKRLDALLAELRALNGGPRQ